MVCKLNLEIVSNNKIKTNIYIAKRSRLSFYSIMRTKVLGCFVTNTGLRDFFNLLLQIINIVELKEFATFSINLLYIPAVRELYIMFYSFSFVACGLSVCLYHHACISGTYLRLRKKLCVALLDLVRADMSMKAYW